MFVDENIIAQPALVLMIMERPICTVIINLCIYTYLLTYLIIMYYVKKELLSIYIHIIIKNYVFWILWIKTNCDRITEDLFVLIFNLKKVHRCPDDIQDVSYFTNCLSKRKIITILLNTPNNKINETNISKSTCNENCR